MPLRALVALVVAAALAPAAHAATPKPFGTHDCVAGEGVRYCKGTIANRVATFDGVPIEVNVTLPAGATARGRW